jgi:hypothetical protein
LSVSNAMRKENSGKEHPDSFNTTNQNKNKSPYLLQIEKYIDSFFYILVMYGNVSAIYTVTKGKFIHFYSRYGCNCFAVACHTNTVSSPQRRGM